MSEYLIICKKCKQQKTSDLFTKNKKICKTCRNDQAYNNYNVQTNKLELREEFLTFLRNECNEKNISDDFINRVFIKEEKIDQLKKENYIFEEIPFQLKKQIQSNHMRDSKYIRDILWVEKDHQGQIKFII